MNTVLRAAAAAFALVALGMAPAKAATQIVDGDGILIGALGVDVQGDSYNVFFSRTGSCAALFDGCDDAEDFDFTNQNDAFLAAIALSSQVVQDTPLGDFDSDPALLGGCGSRCNFLVPYSPFDPTRVSVATFFNDYQEPILDGFSMFSLLDITEDISADNGFFGERAFARFSLVEDLGGTGDPGGFSAVPVPGALPLLLAGLGGLAFMRRRR